MQLNSIIKFGGLAFDVANDEKVRELAGMVHKGAKRRGLLFVPPATQAGHTSVPTTPAHWPKSQSPIPFAPGHHTSAPAKPQAEAPKPQPKAESAAPAKSTGPNGWDVGKWVNMDSAKKIAGWVGTFNQILNKE
ncbi:hypothetical protein [Alicyclobacillus acidiphilus]|uniref:hypothetical protein n=1 Tax=Alicyclobacillus acidiphilus TaxID=182455 RepID=UPI0012EE1297|nr:hypothetical protein [Alicyclobacillus acidiphilus]